LDHHKNLEKLHSLTSMCALVTRIGSKLYNELVSKLVIIVNGLSMITNISY